MPSALFTAEEIRKAAGGEWISFPPQRSLSISTDSRNDCSGKMFLALKGDNFDGHSFLAQAVESGAEALCINRKSANFAEFSEKIPVFTVADTLKAYQCLANFHRNRLKKTIFIGITGSSGKTSTKEILKNILSFLIGEKKVFATVSNTNNQIGVPQNILSLGKNHSVAVIEMGTNHPGEMKKLSMTLEPDIAMITNIGASHLEFFKTKTNVALEKSDIFSGLKKGGAVVIPGDSKFKNILRANLKEEKIISFGTAENCDIQLKYNGGNIKGSEFELIRENKTFSVQWNLKGKHQSLNAAAAASAAELMDFSLQAVSEALKGVSLSGMRMKSCRTDGTYWINDAYNANPESMKSALDWLSEFAFPEKILLVLGDMLELGEKSGEYHISLLKYAEEKLPGAEIVTVGKIFAKNSYKSVNKIFLKSEDAIEYVKKSAKFADYVLLKASRGIHLENIENTVLNKENGA